MATFGYTFAVPNSGNIVNVCKDFFLTTLKYHPKNDAVITSLMKAKPIGALTACEDRRGKHPPARKSDGDAIKEYLYSCNPQISRYRREHAPIRKYLPRDITVTDMHKDFVEKYPYKKCCYQLYRKHVYDQKISFTKLGKEQCEVCKEYYHAHSKSCRSPNSEDSGSSCNVCKRW